MLLWFHPLKNNFLRNLNSLGVLISVIIQLFVFPRYKSGRSGKGGVKSVESRENFFSLVLTEEHTLTLIFLVFTKCPFSVPGSYPEYYITFIYHVPLGFS